MCKPHLIVWPLVFLSLSSLLLLVLYLLSNNNDHNRNFRKRQVESTELLDFSNSTEVVDGYLVWNPKCRIKSEDPLDPSIVKFVRKQQFIECNTSAVLSSLRREANGNVYLTINLEPTKHYTEPTCCWSPVRRPDHTSKNITDQRFDSKVEIGKCQEYKDTVQLPTDVDTLIVRCSAPKPSKRFRGKPKNDKPTYKVYENVHSIFKTNRLNLSDYARPNSTRRKLSVLMLGIDSVSRLNFHRSMPLSRKHLENRGWLELRGYNKIGDNTYPNLMAFLTGRSQSQIDAICKPSELYGFDKCLFIWRSFREAGYVTAYAEDETRLGTFNYLHPGFVEPPTDYYLRPYVLASETLEKPINSIKAKYCTGPLLSFDRIVDSAIDFAKTLIGQPYFGLFWTNSISHDDVNGLSSLDEHFLGKLQELDAAGVTNDSMLILLSDHGMRFGGIRNSGLVGWHQDRLPFIYIWLPQWFRDQEPEAYAALRVNRHRLTSPFDLYETLRDLVIRANGSAAPNGVCPDCNSLFNPVSRIRGCADAGIPSHWCTCDTFKYLDPTDRIVEEGARLFVNHISEIVGRYRNKKGSRLCAELRVKKIHRVYRIVEPEASDEIKLFYVLEVNPGGGLYEATIGYRGPGNYSINGKDVNRINVYYYSAKCLPPGYDKQFCHCVR